MTAAAINWLVAGASALTALGIFWAALRRTARAATDFVRVVRELLELQPRVVELGERLVELVEQHNRSSSRLDRLEAVVFPNPFRKDNHHVS